MSDELREGHPTYHELLKENSELRREVKRLKEELELSRRHYVGSVYGGGAKGCHCRRGLNGIDSTECPIHSEENMEDQS